MRDRLHWLHPPESRPHLLHTYMYSKVVCAVRVCIVSACMCHCMATMAEIINIKCRLNCSFTANVVGIKFYQGYKYLQAVKPVYLRREHGNIHDSNAVLVIIKTTDKHSATLGHLERNTAHVVVLPKHLCHFVSPHL